jgi:ubiquinone/menaquinone biosynthesis C-methylase UbiE
LELMEVVLSHRVCPWWVGYFLASPLRRLMLDPEKVIGTFVREGMTVLEPGPGMGFFTLELARLVGPSGRVVAVDIQPRMLAGLQRRAVKAGVSRRVETRQAAADSLNIADLKERIDFTLAFAVVHEMPSASRFFVEAAQVSKPGAALLLVEPAGHVKETEFKSELEAAAQAGFSVAENRPIRSSQAAVLKKDSGMHDQAR